MSAFFGRRGRKAPSLKFTELEKIRAEAGLTEHEPQFQNGQKTFVSLRYTDECIDHGQNIGKNVYGHSGSLVLHRVMFNMVFGFLPEVVIHTCDNPRCINPRHIRPGTRAINNQDRAAKGRSAKYVVSRRKITQEQADEIKMRWRPGRGHENTAPKIAKDYEVDSGVVYNILKGRSHFASPDETQTPPDCQRHSN